jgi:hypothetical protein
VLRAEQFAVALVEYKDDQWYLVGQLPDIQRLHDAGFVSRAWDIKLDNGHRPYAVLKKRVNFENRQIQTPQSYNMLTGKLSSLLGVSLQGNVHDITQTYLFRPTPAFWADLYIDFADDAGGIANVDPKQFYAIYQGFIIYHIHGVKFIRLESEAISKKVFPALS